MPNIISINHNNVDLYLSSRSSTTATINHSISSFNDNELNDEIDENTDTLSINSDSIDNRVKSTPISSLILSEENKLSQWVSCIKEIRSSCDLNNGFTFLNDILGPICLEDLNRYLIDDDHNEVDCNNFKDKTIFKDRLTQIIFKINEKVFVDEINIYERSFIEDSFLIQIEALNSNGTNLDEWVIIWKNSLEKNDKTQIIKHRIFTPKIISTFFKTDTIRITLSGSLYLINAIEIVGKKIAVDFDMDKKIDNSKANKEMSLSSLSKNFNELILNDDLFADVYLEVDGKLIPAHKNILSCRCEYFKAMFNESNSFKESYSSPKNPTYIKNINYKVFIEFLNYIYTGHINYEKIDYYNLMDLIKLSDLMNLRELQQLCLVHFSQILSKDNVIEIYKEAYILNLQLPNIFTNLLNLCYDLLVLNFMELSKTAQFCSLSQDLMINIIQMVLPRLKKQK